MELSFKRLSTNYYISIDLWIVSREWSDNHTICFSRWALDLWRRVVWFTSIEVRNKFHRNKKDNQINKNEVNKLILDTHGTFSSRDLRHISNHTMLLNGGAQDIADTVCLSINVFNILVNQKIIYNLLFKILTSCVIKWVHDRCLLC